MKAEDTSFLNLLGGGQRQYVIPVFQRDYSWTEAQCSQLLQDVLTVAKRAAGATHFIGSVVYVASEDHSAMLPQWLVIDGQQRLTTCTLLLTVLRDRLRGVAEVPIEESAEALDDQYLLNKFAPPALRTRLALRGADHQCLQALVHRLPTQGIVGNRVLANAAFFEQALAELDPRVVLAGLRRLMVVSVRLTAGQDNPQLIFESLNSTGMALTQADLVRNYVLMGHPEPQQTEWYETWWLPLEKAFGTHYRASFDNFLRDFLTLELRPSQPLKLEHVYREFRNWYPASTGAAGQADAQTRLTRLLRSGQHYCHFMFGSPFGANVEMALRRLQGLVDVAAPAVMVLLERWQHEQLLSEFELVEALELLESYVLRRSMIGAETRSGGKVFAALAQRITQDRPLARLKAALARLGKGAEFPDDIRFAEALATQDLYGRRNLKYLLDRLTNTGKEKVVTDDLTIEHVLPQKESLAPEWQAMLGADWKAVRDRVVHRLGNLTLTGFNSELQARAFEEKRTHAEWGYLYSPVSLSRSIASEEQWGPLQIESRGRLLAKRATQVWKPLNPEEAMLKQLDLEDAQERSAGYSLEDIKFTAGTEAWFAALRAAIHACGPEVVELPRPKSVVYRAPDWFVEVLPRARSLLVRLAVDVTDVTDLAPEAEDASAYAFIPNSAVNGGCLYTVGTEAQLATAKALIARTYSALFEQG